MQFRLTFSFSANPEVLVENKKLRGLIKMIGKNNTYLKFPKGEQTEFLRLVKSKLSLTWLKIARILNVDRSMIYFYLSEYSKMSYPSYLKLCEISNLDTKRFEYKLVTIVSKGTAEIPNEITPELAEFVGILLGDGYISNSNYQICITMDSLLDKEYINDTLKKYFVSLFGKEPLITYSKRARSVRCIIYSREVCDFLTKSLGLPDGKRTYNPRNVIPSIFFRNNNLLQKVIRGLFDTEGGFYQHNKTSPRLYIYNRSEALLDSICLALTQLGYKAIKKKRWVKICKKCDIERFFNDMGTSNYQKKLKYTIWLEEKEVPSSARILNIIHGSGPAAQSAKRQGLPIYRRS